MASTPEQEASKWKEITSQFQGRCKYPNCRNTFEVGDTIKWRSGYGAMCLSSQHTSVVKKNKKLIYAEPTAGGRMTARVAYGWQEVERTSEPKRTTAEWRNDPIPIRYKG